MHIGYNKWGSLFRDIEKNKELGALEAQVYQFVEILSEQRAATRDNVQRKQARTDEEREESDEEQVSDDDSDDDENDIPYNPKNLPLGWDGKVTLLGLSINEHFQCFNSQMLSKLLLDYPARSHCYL